MGEIKAASTVLRFFLSHFLFLFLVLKKGSNIHNGFPVSKIKGKIDLRKIIMNRAWRDLEKIRGAMPLTAGSTLFLPFKSGAKVGPISCGLLLVGTCFPLFLLAGEIKHARAIQQDENIHTIRNT